MDGGGTRYTTCEALVCVRCLLFINSLDSFLVIEDYHNSENVQVIELGSEYVRRSKPKSWRSLWHDPEYHPFMILWFAPKYRFVTSRDGMLPHILCLRIQRLLDSSCLFRKIALSGEVQAKIANTNSRWRWLNLFIRVSDILSIVYYACRNTASKVFETSRMHRTWIVAQISSRMQIIWITEIYYWSQFALDCSPNFATEFSNRWQVPRFRPMKMKWEVEWMQKEQIWLINTITEE